MRTLIVLDRARSESVRAPTQDAAIFKGIQGRSWPLLRADEEPTFPQGDETLEHWNRPYAGLDVDVLLVSDEDVVDERWQFLGFDVAWLNEYWSLYSALYHDVVWREIGFAEYRPCLNAHGLFDDLERADAFLRERREKFVQGLMEDELSTFECFRIYADRWRFQ